MKMNREILSDCTLCPRECHVNRAKGLRGYCRVADKLVVARAALHMWEEPCFSGESGSGTVFFSGCSLGCVYCQNTTTEYEEVVDYAISQGVENGFIQEGETASESFIPEFNEEGV